MFIMTDIMSSRDAQNHFGSLLDRAQHAPVIIKRHKRDCVAVISMQDFAQWQAFTSQNFLSLRDDLAQKAAQRGLTPDILSEILASDA